MKKGIFLDIIAASLLCSISLAGANFPSEEPQYKCIKEETGAPITSILTYDNGRSAICGDEEGNIYRVVNGNRCNKLLESTLGSIDSISNGNEIIGDFCFVASGRMYGYKDGKSIEVSGNLQEEIKRVTVDDNSNKICAVTKANNVYCLSGDNSIKWVPAAAKVVEKILKNSSKNASNRMMGENVSSYAGLHGNEFLGKNNGQIYESDPYAPQPLTVSAEYVSDAVGGADKAIYRITIT
jgi:hypothetical protein